MYVVFERARNISLSYLLTQSDSLVSRTQPISLTRVTLLCVLNRPQQYRSNVTEILISRFALEHRYKTSSTQHTRTVSIGVLRARVPRYSDFEVAIGDPVSTVRFAVIEALTPRFDEYFQAQNLRVLFIALNDEVFRIRLAAIRVIARLTDLNPAYILPALRQTLVQILVELRYGSTPRPQEEGEDF